MRTAHGTGQRARGYENMVGGARRGQRTPPRADPRLVTGATTIMGWPHPCFLSCVGPIQRLDSGTAVTDGLRVMAERHGRIGMAGDLRDQTDLDAFRLQR